MACDRPGCSHLLRPIMAQPPSSCLQGSLSGLNKAAKIELALAAAAGVSGTRNRQIRLHQHRSPSCSVTVLGAVASYHLDAPLHSSIASLSDCNVSREQSTRDAARDEDFMTKAHAVLRRMDDEKVKEHTTAEELVADPEGIARAQHQQLTEDLDTFQRTAASCNTSLGSDRFRRRSGTVAKDRLERLLMAKEKFVEDAEPEHGVPRAARCMHRVRQKLRAAETLRERRKWRRALQQLTTATPGTSLEAGLAADDLDARRLKGNRHVLASASTAQAEADLGPSLNFSHPVIKQSKNAIASTRTAQEACEQSDENALSIMLDNALPPLSRDEETALIKDFRAGQNVQRAIERLQGREGEMQSAEELTRTLKMPLHEICKALELGLKAKHALLQANKRLVFKLAHRHGNLAAVPLEEYVMAGMQGLYKGLEKWDPSRGHRLSTLLYWWIRSEITTVTSELRGTVPLPKTACVQLRKVQLTRRYLTDQRGRCPSEEELAWEMQMSPIAMRSLLRMECFTEVAAEDALRPTSQEGMARESDLLYSDILASREEDSPLYDQRQAAVIDALEGMMRELPQRQVDVLQRVYGLQTGEPQSQQQVARDTQVTFATVNNIRKAALEALRAQGTAQDIRAAFA